MARACPGRDPARVRHGHGIGREGAAASHHDARLPVSGSRAPGARLWQIGAGPGGLSFVPEARERADRVSGADPRLTGWPAALLARMAAEDLA